MGAAFHLTVYHSLPVMRKTYSQVLKLGCSVVATFPNTFPSARTFCRKSQKPDFPFFLELPPTSLFKGGLTLDGKADIFRVFFSVHVDFS